MEEDSEIKLQGIHYVWEKVNERISEEDDEFEFLAYNSYPGKMTSSLLTIVVRSYYAMHELNDSYREKAASFLKEEGYDTKVEFICRYEMLENTDKDDIYSEMKDRYEKENYPFTEEDYMTLARAYHHHTGVNVDANEYRKIVSRLFGDDGHSVLLYQMNILLEYYRESEEKCRIRRVLTDLVPELYRSSDTPLKKARSAKVISDIMNTLMPGMFVIHPYPDLSILREDELRMLANNIIESGNPSSEFIGEVTGMGPKKSEEIRNILITAGILDEDGRILTDFLEAKEKITEIYKKF